MKVESESSSDESNDHKVNPDHIVYTYLNVITWNCHQAVTMPDRLRRRDKIHDFIGKWAMEPINKEGDKVDVLVLQEMNNWRCGPIGMFLYMVIETSFLYMILPSILLQILDYFVLIEGYIAPFFVYENRSDTIQYAKECGFKHIVQSVKSTSLIDTGFLILSRSQVSVFPPKAEAELAPDSVHNPGFLAVSFFGEDSDEYDPQWRLITTHMVPSLPNTTMAYRICNWLNKKRRKDPVLLRRNAARAIREEIQEHLTEQRVVLLGDLNIDHRERKDELADIVKLWDLENIPLDPRFSSSVCQKSFPGEGIIDYVMVDKFMKHVDDLDKKSKKPPPQHVTVPLKFSPEELRKKRLVDLIGSDHLPLFARV